MTLKTWEPLRIVIVGSQTTTHPVKLHVVGGQAKDK